MKKYYTLWLHWKQGDDFYGAGQDFKAWAERLEDCACQAYLLGQHQDQITVMGADTHHIGLEMDEELAEILIKEGVNLDLDELEEDEEV